MAVLESYIEKKILAWAKLRGWFARKLQWIGRAGAPDRLFVKAGRLVFMELKAEGKKPTEIQDREITRLREAGAEVHVVDNIDAGIRILAETPSLTPSTDHLVAALEAIRDGHNDPRTVARRALAGKPLRDDDI